MTAARGLARGLCVLSALWLASCDNSSGTTPSSLFTTETFTGSIGRGATPLATFHTFITGQNAPVIIRMTALSPANITMGLAVGMPAPLPTGGTVCSVTVGQAAIQQGSEFLVDLPAATYCLGVFDPGSIPEATPAVSYTAVVQHK